MSRGTYIVFLAALRHLYHVTLKRPGWLKGLPRKNREHKPPVVLSQEEAQRLFSVVTNLKHKTPVWRGRKFGGHSRQQYNGSVSVRFQLF